MPTDFILSVMVRVGRWAKVPSVPLVLAPAPRETFQISEGGYLSCTDGTHGVDSTMVLNPFPDRWAQRLNNAADSCQVLLSIAPEYGLVMRNPIS